MRKLVIGLMSAAVMAAGIGSFATPASAAVWVHPYHHHHYVPFCVVHPFAFACRPHPVWHHPHWHHSHWHNW
jgi:hypothetical protein